MDNKNIVGVSDLALGAVLFSGFFSGVFSLFLILKLCNVITWSWWWVVSPLWISAILYVLILVGVFIYYYCQETARERALKKRRKQDDKDK